MKRTLAVTCLLAWILCCCGFQQRAVPKNRKPNQESANTSQTDPKGNKQDGNTSISGQPSAATSDKNSDREKGDSNENVYIAAPEKTVEPVEHIVSIVGLICTVALTIVGIVGICFGWHTLRAIQRQGLIMIHQTRVLRRQTKATEDAAKAAKDSVDLQKTLKRQWINFNNWNIRGDSPVVGRRASVSLSFNVVNPSDMRLRLRHVEILMLEGNKVLSPNIMLTPRQPYFARFEFDLSEADTIAYNSNLLRLKIFGNIAFVDNFGDRQNQVFGEICVGGINGFTFHEFEGWLGTEEDDDQDG